METIYFGVLGVMNSKIILISKIDTIPSLRKLNMP
jgi:hypothetical protein